jgi:hypothetical protein
MRRLILSLALCLAALPAAAEEVVLGLSSDTVSINTNFDGSEILIFGAVKRVVDQHDNANGHAQFPLEMIPRISN